MDTSLQMGGEQKEFVFLRRRARGIGLAPLSLFLLLVLPAPCAILRAQEQGTISVEVRVVNEMATVRDKHGKIISNLAKDDFVLEEDGHPQAITYFSPESDLPLTIGLLVDTSDSQRRVLDQERKASYSFLENMLREKDLAFAIYFDSKVKLLLRPSSREILETALKPPGEANSSAGASSGDSQGSYGVQGTVLRYSGGGTLLYDAVSLASREVMRKQQGRKALIILSDGVDEGSKETLLTAIESAERADVEVYSILFSDAEFYGSPGGIGGLIGNSGGIGPGGLAGMGGHGIGQVSSSSSHLPDGKEILKQISKGTGGHFFEVSKKQPIDEIYSEIAEELRNQYSLGYTPGAHSRAGYHKILLRTKQKDQIVQTRQGYYADQ